MEQHSTAIPSAHVDRIHSDPVVNLGEDLGVKRSLDNTTHSSQRQCTPFERETLAGLLVNEVDSTRRLSDSTVYVGLGYKFGQTPIDVLGLVLSAPATREMNILVVDEFQRINQVPESEVIAGATHIVRTLDNIRDLFGLTNVKITLASELMQSPQYQRTHEDIQQRILGYPDQEKIREMLQRTIPGSKRAEANFDYAISEIAISEHMRRHEGITMKLGPAREKLYDTIMRELKVPLDFAYVVDALPTGSKKVEPVVHYIATHRGRYKGANRILIEDSLDQITHKLENSAPAAIEALSKLHLIAHGLSGAQRDNQARLLPERLFEDIVLPLGKASR